MMPYATYHPSSDAAATANYLLEALGIPCDPLGAHQWIVAGVAPDIVYRLAELMKTPTGGSSGEFWTMGASLIQQCRIS